MLEEISGAFDIVIPLFQIFVLNNIGVKKQPARPILFFTYNMDDFIRGKRQGMNGDRIAVVKPEFEGRL